MTFANSDLQKDSQELDSQQNEIFRDTVVLFISIHQLQLLETNGLNLK